MARTAPRRRPPRGGSRRTGRPAGGRCWNAFTEALAPATATRSPPGSRRRVQAVLPHGHPPLHDGGRGPAGGRLPDHRVPPVRHRDRLVGRVVRREFRRYFDRFLVDIQAATVGDRVVLGFDARWTRSAATR
ncbi:hypothetical protein V2I01_28020 [Micromonospora sp. BRA006-A]|nr:hypothetical protein [Micromonospora sp. BRA006-A]